MRRALIFLTMIFVVSGCAKDQPESSADLILIGGHILTQTNASTPTAVALAGGEILSVGTDDQASARTIRYCLPRDRTQRS